MSFPNWWLSSVRETRSTRFAGGVATFGLLKEWRCRTRNLDESSVSLDFWCGTGLSWVKYDVWLPQHQVIYIPGSRKGTMAPAWAELSIQPYPAFPGRALWSHLLEREVFPAASLSYYPSYFFFLWFTSPKWPFFLFLGEEAWPVFSYLPCTWPHKSWDIHKTLSKEFSPKMNVALWRV